MRKRFLLSGILAGTMILCAACQTKTITPENAQKKGKLDLKKEFALKKEESGGFSNGLFPIVADGDDVMTKYGTATHTALASYVDVNGKIMEFQPDLETYERWQKTYPFNSDGIALALNLSNNGFFIDTTGKIIKSFDRAEILDEMESFYFVDQIDEFGLMRCVVEKADRSKVMGGVQCRWRSCSRGKIQNNSAI